MNTNEYMMMTFWHYWMLLVTHTHTHVSDAMHKERRRQKVVLLIAEMQQGMKTLYAREPVWSIQF